MEFVPLTGPELDAVYEYAKALREGRVSLPDGVVLGEDVERTIDNMLLMKATLRVRDHNSIHAVFKKIGVIHPDFYEQAMAYQPPPQYLN